MTPQEKVTQKAEFIQAAIKLGSTLHEAEKAHEALVNHWYQEQEAPELIPVKTWKEFK